MASVYHPLTKVILTIVLLVSFTSIAEGSCWRYGHSCWGGHGKRSGRLAEAPKVEESQVQNSEELQLTPVSLTGNGNDNDYLESSPETSKLNYESGEPNGNENDVKLYDYDQTDSELRERPKLGIGEQYASWVSNRNDGGLNSDDTLSDGSYEYAEPSQKNTLPQSSSSINPRRSNRILYKRDLLRKKFLRRVKN